MQFDITLHDFVTDTVIKFVSKISQAKTLNEIVACVHSVIEKFGIDSFTFYEFTAPECGLIEGSFPVEWTDRYKDKGYGLYDPVFRRLRYNVSAFDWRELTQGFANGPSKRILNEATEFGLCNGYTIPVCDLRGLRCILSFSGRQIEPHPKLLPALTLISTVAHAKYAEIKENEEEAEHKTLTDREIECLHWSAAGKSDWVIGQILAIKETTVRTHIEHARLKLNATSKLHAVAEALRRRILIP